MDIGIGLGSGIAIYFVMWWLCFYVVLTLHDRRPDPEEAQVPGADKGAPARHRLGRKIFLTTLASGALFAAFVVVINSGLTLQDVPLPAAPGT